MSTDTAPPAATADAVLELRQYTLRPHTRDTLIALFDSTFVESQEAVGMSVLGQFRDLDDPERFVWLRGRSEEHTSELQSLMRISYAVFCLKKKKITTHYP